MWASQLGGSGNGVVGRDGKSAYEVAVANGFVGTESEWLASLGAIPGPDGRSAYQVAVDGGFVGTEAEWLASLVGAPGPQGDQGPQGTAGTNGSDGNTVLYGSGVPNNANGSNGNFYIDYTNKVIYGPKAAGVWPEGTSIIGPQGAKGDQGLKGDTGAAGTNGTNGTDGKTIRYGTTAPTAGVGVDGDFYINTSTNTIYGPKAGGAWPAGTSIVGPQGPAGPTGPASVNPVQVNKGTISSGTVTFDFSGGNYQRLQVGGALSVDFSNFPAAGTIGEMEIEAVNWGAFAVTFAKTINWIQPDGTTTTNLSTYLTAVGRPSGLPSAGTAFIYLRSNGTTFYGEVA